MIVEAENKSNVPKFSDLDVGETFFLVGGSDKNLYLKTHLRPDNMVNCVNLTQSKLGLAAQSVPVNPVKTKVVNA